MAVVVFALGVSFVSVSILAAASEPGDSYDVAAFEPTGVPVEGSRDEASAPVLMPGQYVDTLPVGNDPLFYHVRRTVPGSTIHVGATARSVVEGISTLHVRLAVDETSNKCGHEVGSVSNVFGARQLGSAAAHTWQPESDHECNTADEVIVQVNQGETELGGVPFELVVYEERPLASTEGMHPIEDDVSWEHMEPADDAATVTPGTGPSNAPAVEPGTYAGQLSVGEAHFYAIPLDWGERLQAEIHTGPLHPRRIDDTAVEVRILGPVRESTNTPLDVEDAPTWPRLFLDVDNGESFRTGAISPTVSFLNRTKSATAAGALPGLRYVEVQLYGDDQSRVVPYTLTLQTFGTAGEGAPDYVGTGGGTAARVPAPEELIRSANVTTDPPETERERPSGADGGDPSSPSSPLGDESPSTSPLSAPDDGSAGNGGEMPTLPMLLGGLGLIFAISGGVMFAKAVRRHGLIR